MPLRQVPLQISWQLYGHERHDSKNFFLLQLTQAPAEHSGHYPGELNKNHININIFLQGTDEACDIVIFSVLLSGWIVVDIFPISLIYSLS